MRKTLTRAQSRLRLATPAGSMRLNCVRETETLHFYRRAETLVADPKLALAAVTRRSFAEEFCLERPIRGLSVEKSTLALAASVSLWFAGSNPLVTGR